MSGLVDLGNRILNIAPSWSWLPPLLARIAMGWVFITSGLGKLQNLDRVTGFFNSLGIPAPGAMAPFVGTVELVAGVLLIAGLATRLSAIPLVIIMVVALLTAIGPSVEGLRGLFGTQEFLYVIMLIWLMVAGPGPVSIDSKVSGKYRS